MEVGVEEVDVAGEGALLDDFDDPPQLVNANTAIAPTAAQVSRRALIGPLLFVHC